jgi:hypothetical protein
MINKVMEAFFSSTERMKSHLFIIDNAPGSVDYPTECWNNNKCTYISMNKNIGYGSAHNIALKKALLLQSSYHLILNPDVFWEGNVISDLVLYMDKHQETVYILPKVLYPNGELQYLCKLLPTPLDLFARRFLPNIPVTRRIESRFVLKKTGYNKIMNPPCLSGCFMLLRLSTIAKYKLYFDARFFMYFEDFDLIRRCHRVGETIFYPYVSIFHDHARQAYTSKKMLFEFIKSAFKYFNKYGWVFDKERKKMNRKILSELEM